MCNVWVFQEHSLHKAKRGCLYKIVTDLNGTLARIVIFIEVFE